MNKQEIEEELRIIKADLTTVLKEDSTDSDSFEFIAHKAILLTTRIHVLKAKIESAMDNDKEFKIAYQKLHNSLEHIESSLKFKMPLYPTAAAIEHKLGLIKAKKEEIENL
jgi:hypothetical protein